jgi:8-oxo-dGTP pyrophosphatase MutT (NUDIX family)
MYDKKYPWNVIKENTYPAIFNKSPRRSFNKIFGSILRCESTNRYLLVKGKESNKYSFAKGHIEPHETPMECIQRELFEETGIDIYETMMKSIIRSKIGTYIYSETETEIPINVLDTQEISEAGWYDIDEIRNLQLNADVSYYFHGMGLL